MTARAFKAAIGARLAQLDSALTEGGVPPALHQPLTELCNLVRSDIGNIVAM